MAAPIRFQKPKPIIALRVGLLFSTLLGAGALLQFQDQITREGLVLTSVNFRAALYLMYALVGVLALLSIAAWTRWTPRLLAAPGHFQALIGKWRPLALILFATLSLLFPVIVLGFYGRFLLTIFTRLFFFWVFAALGAVLLAAWRDSDWLETWPASVLCMVSVYLAGTFFSQVTNYPFSLEWSEGSRYYQASFYFSDSVYGVHLPLPITHPSRYLLQSIPFLIQDSPLWLHRLWQAMLWVGMPALTAWTLARRLRIQPKYLLWLFIGWAFLFLMQGAVFYHLLPCVFLVLLGFDSKRPWRSFVFIALASVWAGISRINWVPLPGALAALLYFLEAKPAKGAPFFSLRYLGPPALHAVGGSLVALGAYALYILNSGNPDPGQFGSSFTSDLLWVRLWPNAAFPLGILPGSLVVSAPLFALLWLRLRQPAAKLGLWRSLAIALLLVIFFVGGLVVSVKIGGGTNLHNMDDYLVLLLVLTSACVFGAFVAERHGTPAPITLPALLIVALIAIPAGFAVLSGEPLALPGPQVADDVLAQIQTAANDALAAGGEVLFISQRHLLTFHLIDGVPLVHEYEKLFLMEMAISHNDNYLDQFAKDIDEQRFRLIVTDPVFNNIVEDDEDSLAAENNAWVRSVGRPLLCAYERSITFSDPAIQLLTPRYGNKCNQ